MDFGEHVGNVDPENLLLGGHDRRGAGLRDEGSKQRERQSGDHRDPSPGGGGFFPVEAADDDRARPADKDGCGNVAVHDHTLGMLEIEAKEKDKNGYGQDRQFQEP